jgi:hypothetical protein
VSKIDHGSKGLNGGNAAEPADEKLSLLHIVEEMLFAQGGLLRGRSAAYCCHSVRFADRRSGADAAPAVVEADTNTTPESKSCAVARYLWAMLLTRIYEAFPLHCPNVD